MNIDKLRDTIDKSGKTITHIASVLGITREGLYNKLNGEVEFKLSEVQLLTEDLRLTTKERDDIFFNN